MPAVVARVPVGEEPRIYAVLGVEDGEVLVRDDLESRSGRRRQRTHEGGELHGVEVVGRGQTSKAAAQQRCCGDAVCGVEREVAVQRRDGSDGRRAGGERVPVPPLGAVVAGGLRGGAVAQRVEGVEEAGGADEEGVGMEAEVELPDALLAGFSDAGEGDDAALAGGLYVRHGGPEAVHAEEVEGDLLQPRYCGGRGCLLAAAAEDADLQTFAYVQPCRRSTPARRDSCTTVKRRRGRCMAEQTTRTRKLATCTRTAGSGKVE